EDDIDAVLFWETSPSTDGSFSNGSADAVSDELTRRQRLAQATLPFRGSKIRFQKDRAAFTPESEDALNAVIAELRRDGGLALLVKAFADAREANGSQLSEERAGRVVAWLTARGVSPARLVARGCGSSRALWTGETEEQRGANRRAELVRNSPREGCTPPSS